MYIVSQIIGFIAFIVSLIAYQRKKKKDILFTGIIASILNLIHYLILGGYSGAVTKAIAILRDTFIVCKEKKKVLNNILFLVIFILLYLCAMIYTYNGILSIFPLVAALIYLIPTWFGNSKTVKKAALFCYFLWLIYNIFVLSIAGVISNTVSIISIIISLKRGEV